MLTKTSISRPVSITMFFFRLRWKTLCRDKWVLLFRKYFAFSNIGVDLLPNINLPHLLVQTTYPNASPEEIEKLVTEPLEAAIGTVTGVKKITSVSKY